MTKSAIPIAASLILSLGLSANAQLQTCGTARYDPSQYVCHDNNFLCPIVAGEGLSYCNGACYSKFIYTCTNNVLSQLSELAAGTPFSLTSSNPAVPAVDGLSVTACGQTWTVGGPVCTYCPESVPSGACPTASTSAVITAGSNSCGMAVSVPGGQQVYLDPSWSVGYTQAHSASIPSGSVTGGLVAFTGGNSPGFINLNSGGWGWYVCPATGAKGYTLHAANASSQATLTACTPINLKVNPLPSSTVGAWQYT